MSQISFSQAEFSSKKKTTRRERFLMEMETLVPWQRLLDALVPLYFPKSKGGRGRPPVGLERMLRIYFLQQWYALADEALEDAIYDSQSLQAFVGIDLSHESVPDATTLLKFRHWLEKHKLTMTLFREINTSLHERGMVMREGTIVDATIIAAASSTKNKDKKRDPEMHQTKKGNQWYFGMKAHIGVDAAYGLVHSLEGTAANEADISVTHKLLQGTEGEEVYADAGYVGIEKRPEVANKNIQWHVAKKRGQVKTMEDGEKKDLVKKVEKIKASIRAKVEHPFHVVKNLFRHRKARYRGLEKNTAQLFSLFALANLVLARRALGVDGKVAF
ncbi:MAG: IS5 family transposase [Hahellaceae bacterium]|nr:IS5 family transposase [Hahellaceae bacterium]MCP5162892.1 IS5 family transposase [Hahellaceae bacterium]MCP5168923.1 IS5 family transposase [Hahellaceae bacterium]MCP5168945.1 IS5 family transposase [Hahellaceae bacterium]